MKMVPYRSSYLQQYNARMSKDITEPLTDPVIEAIMHQQGIIFEHSGEYRNLYSYEKLYEQLEHFDREYATSTEDPYLKHGCKLAYKLFSRPVNEKKLKAVQLTEASAELFSLLGLRRDTSSGLTCYGETKLTAFTIGLDKALKILVDGKAPAPCLAGRRTQRKEKTRLVFMYPLEMTILEAVVARPLIDYFKHEDHVMTFGDYSLEVGMKMRSSACSAKNHCSIDYSSFDSCVPPVIIHWAFNAFRTWFDLNDTIYGDITVRQVIDIIERYFVNTPIVMPNRDGKYPRLWKGKRGGVPSGSYFTQLVDSFANVSLIGAASERFNLNIKAANLYVLGDDCLFFTNATVDQSALSNFLRTFGFKVNPDKGSVGLATDVVEYLGRTWKNGIPVRTMREISRGALYPEKYRKYASRAGVRQEQALAVLSSYLLTSVVEDAKVGTDKFTNVFNVSPWMTSGFARYLMDEGLMPGRVLKRAIY